MTHRPKDDDPAPPGGRAAERLREFIDQRFPGKEPLPEGPLEEPDSEQPADEDNPREQAENQEATEQKRPQKQ